MSGDWTNLGANVATMTVSAASVAAMLYAAVIRPTRDALARANHALGEFERARVAERLDTHERAIGVHEQRLTARDIAALDDKHALREMVRTELQRNEETSRLGRHKIHEHIDKAKDETLKAIKAVETQSNKHEASIAALETEVFRPRDRS